LPQTCLNNKVVEPQPDNQKDMAFLRPYQASDAAATAHICRSTLPPSLQSSEPAWRIAPYVWTHQYTHLSPETCFVLDDGTGRAVGYCIGCPDIPRFCSEYENYLRDVLDKTDEVSRPKDMSRKHPWLIDSDDDKGKVVNEACLAQMAYSAWYLLLLDDGDLLKAGYRATMHIDLLEEWQGKGWGRKLIDAFVKSVREDVANNDEHEHRGIWIGIAPDNAKVVPFYEKMGFIVKERPGKEGSICMVRELVKAKE
jgi:GNAT superfamily N-acetyltransferase